MKQINLFKELNPNLEAQKYSTKVQAPIYEPKHDKPNILELRDSFKAHRLIQEIKKSNVSDEEKLFLIDAASRHIVFNYERIADYYAHGSKEIQELMEKSGLVIIDFEKAIELGCIKLCEQIKDQYLTEYEE